MIESDHSFTRSSGNPKPCCSSREIGDTVRFPMMENRDSLFTAGSPCLNVSSGLVVYDELMKIELVSISLGGDVLSLF